MDTTAAVNDAVASAKSLPDLAAKVAAIDPSLAAGLQSKALIASKTPWGTLLAGAIAYVAGKYGLGWTEGFDELLAGGGVLLGSYAMRYWSPERISGFFTKKTSTATGA